MKHIFRALCTTFFACFLFHDAIASKTDTVKIYSPSMKKEIKAIVVTPEPLVAGKRYPAVYMIHGHSGDFDDYLSAIPHLTQSSDDLQLIFVFPDGGYGSWYFDSPVDSAFQYETHVSKEVVNFVDAHYPTIANKNGRAITGMSMGGHGALYLALRHPDVFGVAGSMSGGVDLTYSVTSWDIAKRLGDYKDNVQEWEKRSVINLIGNLLEHPMPIIIDCGVDDFFYKINIALHEKMLRLKIPHDYIERPGVHNWPYWDNAIDYQLLFFKKYFLNR